MLGTIALFVAWRFYDLRLPAIFNPLVSFFTLQGEKRYTRKIESPMLPFVLSLPALRCPLSQSKGLSKGVEGAAKIYWAKALRLLPW